MKTKHAFTLIEMLVVIAIIGIIATLVLNMNSAAQTAKRNAAVNADKAKLQTLIEQYQSVLNFFPPDNGNLNNGLTLSPAAYERYTAINPLLYELTGATNFPGGGKTLQLFNTNADGTDFSTLFGRQSVANANPTEPHLFYLPPSKEYAVITNGFCGLVVPVPFADTNKAPNFWHYDASSTNRHNLAGYDLWAEYISSSKSGTNNISTNGNW